MYIIAPDLSYKSVMESDCVLSFVSTWFQTAIDPGCIRDIITNTVTSLTSVVTVAVKSRGTMVFMRER